MNIELLSTVSHKWLSVLCFYTLFLLGILVVLWLHISALSLCTGLHVHYHHLLFNPTRGSSISSESSDMLSCLWTIQIVHSPSEGDRRLTREEKALRFCAYRKGQREGRELRTEGLCVSYLYQGPGMGLWGLYPSSVRAVVRLILCFRSPSLAVVGQCLSAEFEHTHLHNFFFFFLHGRRLTTFQFETWRWKIILIQACLQCGLLVLGPQELWESEFCFHCFWPLMSCVDRALRPGSQVSLHAVGWRRLERAASGLLQMEKECTSNTDKPPRNKPYFANRALTGMLREVQPCLSLGEGSLAVNVQSKQRAWVLWQGCWAPIFVSRAS